MRQSGNASFGPSGAGDAVPPPERGPEQAYGEEGTNKTQPEPDPAAQPSDVPGGAKHSERTPVTRKI